ncbi:hypothetical protein ATANTOWER_003770, partial [Ataeniobius toweri]|nr:hypothetical protein [Ataeniobius toweri]
GATAPAETPLRHLICSCAASQDHRKQGGRAFKIKCFKEKTNTAHCSDRQELDRSSLLRTSEAFIVKL